MMKSPILLFLLLLASAAPLLGQVTLHGRMIDQDTREGIPFGNVFFEGTTRGTSTDEDGYYELTVDEVGDSLSASAIGYDVVHKPVDPGLADQEIIFYLGGSSFMLDEVVVIAGENPANAIVRGIIEHKPETRMTARESYAYESYAKIELDLENIDEELRNKKLLKPFEFIFENIDSTSDEKPFLPIYINEVISEVLYVKDAGEPKRIIKAQRATGTNNQTVIEYIKRIHQEYSIYDDWVYVLDKPFASPFSKSGLSYYEYYIIDSAVVNGHWSHQLKFKPKRQQEPTFYGDFWVADTTFAVQRANLRMTPDANINLVSRIIIHEEYEPRGEEPYWVPVKKKMVVDFSPAENAPGMIARRTETFKGVRLNQVGTKQDYIEREEFYRLDEVNIESDSFWQDARHEPLSKTEQQVYTMVDSIKNMPLFKTYVEVLETVFVGYLQIGKVEIGPYASIYSFNPVEGDRFRIGGRTTKAFSENLRLGGFLAYGLKDERFKYGGSADWIMSRRPRTSAGLAYIDDISLNSENSEEFVQGDLFSGLFRRDLLQKLMRVREGKVYYERFWKNGLSNRITFLHRDMDPYGGIFPDGRGFNFAYLSDPGRLTDIDTTIRTTEIIFKARYVKDEMIVDGDFSRSSFGSKHPIIEFQYTLGVDDLLGGQYTYHKLNLSYRHYFYINPMGWLSYRIRAGKVFGTVPFLLMEVHPGNEGYLVGRNIFNMMTRYEFASDTYASLMLEHHFDGFFLNHVPLLRKLKFRSYATFKAIMGSLSNANRDVNRLNLFIPTEDNTYPGFRAPQDQPYMEASIGIENILKVFQIEAVWRLNYLDNPQARRFGLRGGVAFYF